MAMSNAAAGDAALAEPHEGEADAAEAPAGPPEEGAIERLLEHLPAAEIAAAESEAPPAMRTARVVAIKGASAQITWRGRAEPVVAELDDGVDRELVARAMAAGDAVLIEHAPGAVPVIVGVVQRRIPETLELKARSVVIEAEQEVLLRAGRGAMRIREDGDVEVVGSRILTMSRGLFRIVGRVLRLN